MEILYVILAAVLLLLVFIILITVAVKTKNKKYLFGILVAVLAFLGWSAYCVSENVRLHMGKPESVSFSERFDLIIDGFKNDMALEPYDPCIYNDMDAPVRSAGTVSFSQLFLTDFILIVPHNSRSSIEWIPNVEESEFLFSLPRAAYAVQKMMLEGSAVKDKNKPWMIQLLAIDKVQQEPAFVFIVGQGDTSTSCPNYFKQSFKAAVTYTHKLYKFENNEPVLVGKAPAISDEILPMNKDFALNVLDIKDVTEFPVYVK